MRCARTVLVAVAVALAGAVPVRASDVTLRDGAPVFLRLAQVVSSEASRPGDPVTFRVMRDVVVDGVTVIARGTPAHGVVLTAARGRVRGPGAGLLFTVQGTTAVGGQTVHLRPTRDRQPDDRFAGYTPPRSATSLLLWAGEAHVYDAFVDGEHVLAVLPPRPVEPPPLEPPPPVGPLAPAPPVHDPPRPPAGPDVLTNEEIMRLVGSGVSDDVVIAAIETSRPAFRLEAADLIALKEAGVSDRVLLAMIDRSRVRLGVRPRV
jgi:hypothetical protein